MNEISHTPSNISGDALGASPDKHTRRAFSLPMNEWGQEIVFLVCLSLMGLSFYPAYAALLFLVIRSFMRNRYDFIIQITLIGGVYGFYREEALPFKVQDVLFIVSILLMMIYRYTPVMRRITFAMLGYFAVMVIFALKSPESLSVQFKMMRNYMMIVYLFIPLVAFSGEDFDIEYFFRKIISYCLIISVFYIFDGFIYSGFFFLPGLMNFSDEIPSIFNPVYDLFTFPRRYPTGLYILALAIIPAIRLYRLSPAQWLLVILAILTTRTMTFTAGLLVTFFIFQGKTVQMLKFGILGILAVVGAYYVDISLGGELRIASTVEQFTELDGAEDEEDASQFGSGRIAQFVPKYEVLCDQGRRLQGFGFLHPELTSNPDLIIENILYSAGAEEEVVTGVEVTQLQTILDIGYIGLIVQTAFYVMIYFFIRRMRYANYYLSVLVAISLFGLGGFAGLTQTHGLLLLALTLAAVILFNRPDNESEDSGEPLSA